MYWLLREPVLQGNLLDYSSWGGVPLSKALQAAGITTLGKVVELTGPGLEGPALLASMLGIHSERVVKQFLHHWRRRLSGTSSSVCMAEVP